MCSSESQLTPGIPFMKCEGADSGFEIRYDFHGSCRGIWGMPCQENVDFGLLKMAIWCNLGVIIVISASLTIIIYKLCIQNTT